VGKQKDGRSRICAQWSAKRDPRTFHHRGTEDAEESKSRHSGPTYVN
jgi:hypothetical protein